MAGSARILLVEDNELNRSLVRAILTRTKHPALQDAILVEAPDLAHARKSLADQVFDVVLLDVHLPDGSGLTLAREITDGSAQRPALVALTAAALPREQAAALEAGCETFLAKPYTRDEALAKVREALERRQNAGADAGLERRKRPRLRGK